MAEKLEGTSRGVGADALPFHLPSLPNLLLLLHPCFAHPLSYSCFLFPLSLQGGPVCFPNYSQLQMLEVTKYTWFPYL